MENFYLFNDIAINGFSVNLLDIISVISILCGILVIISKNPIVSVLFLIGLFISIAFYLMTLGINFIGLSYLLVYVGAVSILFLFILMLINVRISELVADTTNSIPLAIMIGIFFIVTQLFPFNGNIGSLRYIYKDKSLLDKTELHSDLYGNELYFSSSSLWDGRLAETFHITSIGNIIYTNYPLWLILTSIILLLAMVGSIIITIKQ